MVTLILMCVIGTVCWMLFAVCLKGCNRVLINFYNHKEREKYREQYDVIAMNKYLGINLMLPLAVTITVGAFVLLFNQLEILNGAALGGAVTALGVSVLFTVVRTSRAVAMIMNGVQFRKQQVTTDI